MNTINEAMRQRKMMLTLAAVIALSLLVRNSSQGNTCKNDPKSSCSYKSSGSEADLSQQLAIFIFFFARSVWLLWKSQATDI